MLGMDFGRDYRSNSDSIKEIKCLGSFSLSLLNESYAFSIRILCDRIFDLKTIHPWDGTVDALIAAKPFPQKHLF